jgi:hypothetical protein
MHAHRGPLIALLVLAVTLLGGRAEAGPKPRPGDPGVPDRELQKAIDKAVAKGAEWLRSVQKSHGQIGVIQHGKGQAAQLHYQIGSTALAGLALLAAGDKRGDKAVDAAMEYCRKQDKLRGAGGGRTTYDTGTLLMFAVEYWRDDGGKKPRKKKHTMTGPEARNPCKMPPEIAEWIRDMADWLKRTQESTGDWSYPKPRPDNSNTQYALLGLRAAQECGGTVPGIVYINVIKRLLGSQEKSGPKVLRTIGGEKKGEPIYKIDAGDQARGWSYLDSPYLATGSMTTAGIACLSICHHALTLKRDGTRRDKPLPIYTDQLNRQVRRAIQDGFAWLDINFAVDHNPPRQAAAWHYYYLYGLERAGILGGRTLIGKHDWYITGSRYLVGKQRDDGRWHTGTLGGSDYEGSDVLDTAWAILFLKKATRPAKPIPGPVVTPAPK